MPEMIARSAIQVRKKPSGRYRPEPKLFYPDKVAEVERDNHLAAGFDRDLKHHVVLRVRKKGPPKIEDLPSMPDGAQVVEDVVNIRVCEAEFAGVLPRDSLILEDERHRDIDLKRFAAEAR